MRFFTQFFKGFFREAAQQGDSPICCLLVQSGGAKWTYVEAEGFFVVVFGRKGIVLWSIGLERRIGLQDFPIFCFLGSPCGLGLLRGIFLKIFIYNPDMLQKTFLASCGLLGR